MHYVCLSYISDLWQPRWRGRCGRCLWRKRPGSFPERQRGHPPSSLDDSQSGSPAHCTGDLDRVEGQWATCPRASGSALVETYLCRRAWPEVWRRSRQCHCIPLQTPWSAPWKRHWQLLGTRKRSQWWRSSQPARPSPSLHREPSLLLHPRPTPHLPWCLTVSR